MYRSVVLTYEDRIQYYDPEVHEEHPAHSSHCHCAASFYSRCRLYYSILYLATNTANQTVKNTVRFWVFIQKPKTKVLNPNSTALDQSQMLYGRRTSLPTPMNSAALFTRGVICGGGRGQLPPPPSKAGRYGGRGK